MKPLEVDLEDSEIPVAPFAGAWIETRAVIIYLLLILLSRPSRARGLKQALIERLLDSMASRALRGRVD